MPLTTRTRSHSYTPSSIDMTAAMSLSGLDYMKALVVGDFGARPTIGAAIGMSIPSDIMFGKVTFTTEAEDFLLNPLGMVYGGLAATLLDSCMGCAVHTARPKGIGFSTAELKINYTRAIRAGMGTLRAEGAIIHVDRQMATAEGRLIEAEDGKLYAHGSTTCFLFPLKAPGA
ncbi:MAG: hypothetical protein ACJA1L_003490 [Paracoccaceae bacterium]|jgi:uncharacterized protein (TIGR00369 family)